MCDTACLEEAGVDLGGLFECPVGAVDKMLPDRSKSEDKRVVHDQRDFNVFCPKETHPPAVQPFHRQVARQVLWLKQRYPGLPIQMAKRDVNGAFRLLWLDPRDTELFSTTLPWREEALSLIHI